MVVLVVSHLHLADLLAFKILNYTIYVRTCNLQLLQNSNSENIKLGLAFEYFYETRKKYNTIMDFDYIVTECVGKIKVVRYNRPKKKNALDVDMYRTVSRILEQAARDDNISAVVITGTGDFYSSGNDLSFTNNTSGDFIPALNEFIQAFIKFPKILIAMVNGPAIGIAATTLALCDLVYASENSYFYTPFTKLGFVAEGCSTFTFSRIMGERKALEMLMFNYKMSAKEAFQCGFINDIFKPEELQRNVWDRIQKVSNLRPEILVATKKLMRGQIEDKLLEINDKELRAIVELRKLSKL